MSEPSAYPRWSVYRERSLYDNEWVQLVQVEVEPPEGIRFWHHVVRLLPIAAAVVLDDQDRVLMLRRHRFTMDAFTWELPGGIIDRDENGPATAARETEEETGWRPVSEAKHVCTFEPMPGMVEARHEVYLFRGAEQVGQPTDAEEAGQVAWIPLDDVSVMVAQGEISGAGSLVGLLQVLASRGQH